MKYTCTCAIQMYIMIKITYVNATCIIVLIQNVLLLLYALIYVCICSGYKHFTLIYETTSLPLSVRGAYNATTAPYQTIWCSYFSLFIHLPRVSPAR